MTEDQGADTGLLMEMSWEAVGGSFVLQPYQVDWSTAEGTADEEDTEAAAAGAGKDKVQRGRGVTRGLSSGTGFASIQVPVPESVTHQQQQRKVEVLSPTESGGGVRSSRRLTALVGGGTGSGSESTVGPGGGRLDLIQRPTDSMYACRRIEFSCFP
jgi:hypothetical protein